MYLLDMTLASIYQVQEANAGAWIQEAKAGALMGVIDATARSILLLVHDRAELQKIFLQQSCKHLLKTFVTKWI